MVVEKEKIKKWGTWEELILGGAILRHGINNWDVVALELRSRTRTHDPKFFIPEVCKAKYEALRERYSGCSAWFEELRKKRVNELRKELEKSEESIGSLESELETLKSEKTVCSYPDNGCSAAESSERLIKLEGNESVGKEASREGLSAGSTQETQTNWLQQCHAAVLEASAEDLERKPLELPPLRLEKFPSIDELAETMRSEHGVNIRKRRGKRKRKDWTSKEGVFGENNLMCSADAMNNTLRAKENETSDIHIYHADGNDRDPCTSKQGMDDFVKIFDSIMENEHATAFKRRLDSQKRATYKRIIRQHMDLDTIESRIANKCITSTVGLLQDLLLLANNALVFYSKSTREYKCAFILRDLVTKYMRKRPKTVGNKVVGNAETPKTYPKPPASQGTNQTPKSPMLKPPAKPRSARPFNCKFSKKAVNVASGNATSGKLKACSHPPGIVGSPPSAESSALAKKSQGKKGKVERVKRGNVGIQAETPMKVRKRVRVK